jgi:hypothetical protein
MTVEKMSVESLVTNKPDSKKPETSAPSTTTGTATAAKPESKTKEATNALVLKQPAGFFGNRPIEASHLNIVSTYSSVGSLRPVTASTMKLHDTMIISGNRPISASSLVISETYKVMGSRPVASNDIDDPALLMGFLD